MSRPITLIRRIVQIIAFVLLIYGALLGIRVRTPVIPSVRAPEGFRSEERIALMRGPRHGQVFDTYIGVKTCRFTRGQGLFRACFMHFFSEAITWRTPLRDFLPHLLIFLLLAVMLGTFWCGWVCPLGFILDTLVSIRRRLGLNRFGLSKIWQGFLKKFKFVLLGFILFVSLLIAFPQLPWWLRKELFIVGCQICPSRFIFPYLTGFPVVHSLHTPLLVIFFSISIIFTLTLVMSAFSRRALCRFCPNGVLLSFFNRGSLLTKEKELLRCTRCGICIDSCPLENENVYQEKKNKNVDFPDCIRCFRCVDSCPEDDCLKVKFFGKMIVKSEFKK